MFFRKVIKFPRQLILREVYTPGDQVLRGRRSDPVLAGVCGTSEREEGSRFEGFMINSPEATDQESLGPLRRKIARHLVWARQARAQGEGGRKNRE